MSRSDHALAAWLRAGIKGQFGFAKRTLNAKLPRYWSTCDQ